MRIPALAVPFTLLILLLPVTPGAVAQGVSDEPLVGADRMTIWQADRTTPVVKRGTVVDLAGDRVEFRREGSRSLESISLSAAGSVIDKRGAWDGGIGGSPSNGKTSPLIFSSAARRAAASP